MSSSENQAPTPEHVAKQATVTAPLPSLFVLGIFGSVEAPSALIRQTNGRIARVSVGDSVAGQTVAAIDEDRVILSKGGKTKTLKLPRG